MNAKLKRYAKLKRSLQLLHLNPGVPFQTTWYGRICSEASKVRVLMNIFVQDTRTIGQDTSPGLTSENLLKILKEQGHMA